MKLFEMKNWQLVISEEAWSLLPFQKILNRDKTKGKEKAMKDMLFIYFFCDVRSDYLSMPERERIKEIKHDVGLDDSWTIDSIIQEGIDLYTKGETPLEQLYRQTVIAIHAVGDYLERSKELLEERDKMGKPVNDISKITNAVKAVPKLMSDLKLAYKEVIKEKEDNENKKKGSRSFNIFEEGLNING